MVYNETLKREIPEGWEVKKLGEMESRIITGKTPSRKKEENFGGKIPFVTIGDIRGNTFVWSSAETLSDKGADGQKTKYLPADSLCVSCIATVGEIGFTTQPSQTNQQINSIIFQCIENKYYIYFLLKKYFENAKAKTGNTFANMNKEDFSRIELICPTFELREKYHKTVLPMFEEIKNRSKQNQELAQLRDWLLPMLMNGQVTL